MEQLLLETIAIHFAKTNVSLLQKNLWPISTLLNDFIQQAKEQALADVPCQTQGQSQLVYSNLLKAYSAPVRVWYIVKVCGKCASVFLKLLWPSLKTLRVGLNLDSIKVLSSLRSWIHSLGKIISVFSISISWDLYLRNQAGSNDIFINVSFSPCSVKHSDPLILNSVDPHC